MVRRTGWVVVMVAVWASIAGAAFADDAPPPSKWYDMITVGGELRLRSEGYRHFLPFTPVRIANNNDTLEQCGTQL